MPRFVCSLFMLSTMLFATNNDSSATNPQNLSNGVVVTANVHISELKQIVEANEKLLRELTIKDKKGLMNDPTVIASLIGVIGVIITALIGIIGSRANSKEGKQREDENNRRAKERDDANNKRNQDREDENNRRAKERDDANNLAAAKRTRNLQISAARINWAQKLRTLFTEYPSYFQKSLILARQEFLRLQATYKDESNIKNGLKEYFCSNIDNFVKVESLADAILLHLNPEGEHDKLIRLVNKLSNTLSADGIMSNSYKKEMLESMMKEARKVIKQAWEDAKNKEVG